MMRGEKEGGPDVGGIPQNRAGSPVPGADPTGKAE